jgi:polysaccharide biosynthesis/export protein
MKRNRLYNAARGLDILMVPFSSMGGRYSFLCTIAGGLLCLSTNLLAQDVTVRETPQQANERIRTLSMGAKASAPHDYLLGNGDLISISVFDVPELTREVRVSQTGTIGIPLIPVRLRVAGLTELQAEQKIAEVLEANGLVSHAEVGVMVKEHKSKPITIVGAVTHPMVFEADREVTLLEAVAEAGGIANDAGDTVIVTRAAASSFEEIPDPAPIAETPAPGAGGTTPTEPSKSSEPPELQAPPATPSPAFPSAEEMAQNNSAPSKATTSAVANAVPDANASNAITINLNELLETGDMHNNILLHAGDVVTVPHAGIVYVLGAVNRPGGFVVSNDRTQLTTLKVLSLAGGLTKIAKLNHAVIIRKDDQGKQTETELDLKKVLERQTEDLQMHASDILYVPDDRTKEVLIRAAELGIAIGTAVAIFRLAYH